MRALYVIIILATTIKVSGQLLLDPKRVIFLKETSILYNVGIDSAMVRFTPNAADVDSADAVVMKQLLTNNKQGEESVELTNFFRQYVGFRINNNKYILINGSGRKPDYFFDNIFYPKGGGKHYFRALANLQNKKIIYLYFNAPK